jgi:hypothetical protein
MVPSVAGPDFTESDLDLLVRAARRIAMLLPELEYGDGKHPPRMLRFHRPIDSKKTASTFSG